ncbi:hypothetical protein B0I35DRAFT_397872 [Stachybotrys elegans]|uniref:FAD-binding domain-containing protein n=1 Tax=Stachybotrys elegans TaxID=80388 RepID=A0A8K0WLY3_9HYPO|nr:hypothetical protein B0I35DRAFT_397872 [Stachybotrys elegans]
MAPLRILISGGGIAGNALAFWLSRLGHGVTLVERFPGLRTSGLQLDLRGHGIEVLRRMKLEEAFRERAVAEEGLELVDSRGRTRAAFGKNTSGKGLQNFTTEYEIMRGDFCQLLFDTAKDKITPKFGQSIQSLQENDDHVEVVFNNGNKHCFDLVVGADGVQSQIRRMMFGAGADGMHRLNGIYSAYFLARKQAAPGEQCVARTHIATGGRYIMVRRHSPEFVQVYLICQSSHPRLAGTRPGNIEEEKAAMAEVFEGVNWEMDWILEALRESDDFYLERQAFVKLNSWSQGRLVLVGDAAYCSSPNTGMGTTAAIVGAYILAGEISQHCRGDAPGADGLSTALKAYENKFRPFMDQVQRGLKENSLWWDVVPTSKLGVELIYWLVGWVSFFRLNWIGEYILREDIKNWDLPQYDAMVKRV